MGHGLWNYALGYLPATYMSAVSQLNIVMSATLAFLIFHEIPGLLQLPGSLAIIMGVTLVNFGLSRSV